MYCLQVRKFTYQFCRRVPLDLRHKFPSSTIRHSLQTKDFSEAKRRRNTLLVQYDNEFQRLRLGQCSGFATASNEFQYEPVAWVPQADIPSQTIENQTPVGDSICLSVLTADVLPHAPAALAPALTARSTSAALELAT